MKKTKNKSSLFEEALGEAARDLSKEMGYKPGNKKKQGRPVTMFRRLFSRVREFINSKEIHPVKTVKQR